MAFLDNSGDIILDAVLTDLGRKRMAEGNFRITQFALGDDEIDYSLYNATHPSGSAYYDLEILQTPVFEAFTQTNANINYGLLTLGGAADVLYLPKLKLNELSLPQGLQLNQNVLYLATNNETRAELEDSAALGSVSKVAIDNNSSRYVLFETGIDNATNNPSGERTPRTDYITNLGLSDSSVTLTLDGRFITAVNQLDGGSKFELPEGSTSFSREISFDPSPVPAIGGASGVTGRRTYVLRTIENLVFDQDDGSQTDVSVIVGPRANVVAMYFTTSPDLRATSTAATPAKFSLHGKVAQDLFGDGNTYDYIDTIVYLNGNTTGANTQLIVRVIRAASIA